MDYQWMKDPEGKFFGIWLKEEQSARNSSLLQQLIYKDFGMIQGLSLVAKLSSAKVAKSPQERGGWWVVFDSPVKAPD